MVKEMLTAKRRLEISNFPFRIHRERSLSRAELKVAAWMALKKDIIAVLEYWQGYFLLIPACMRNHEDQVRLATVRTEEPIAQCFVVSDEMLVMTWLIPGISAGECAAVVNGIPL